MMDLKKFYNILSNIKRKYKSSIVNDNIQQTLPPTVSLPFNPITPLSFSKKLTIQNIPCELHGNVELHSTINIADKILFILCNYLQKPTSNLHVRIFLYENKKLTPNDGNFTQDNLNTGYTQFIGTKKYIVVFRSEEWCKVLIHELIHALHKHKFDEAQTEWLATLIYCAILSSTYNDFIKLVTNNLLFGVNQSLKITQNIHDYNRPEVKYHILKTTLLMNTQYVLNCDFVLTNKDIELLHNNSSDIWYKCILYINEYNPFDKLKKSMRMII
jgi:hypothetical protein